MSEYSVPKSAREVFLQGILANPLIQKHLPTEAHELCDNIKFEGRQAPWIPVNWRFAESVSALKAYEATVLNVLLKRKYNVVPRQVKIDCDHAQLFIMSTLLWVLDPEGENLSAASVISQQGREKVGSFFPDWDRHRANSSLFRSASTNIYRTKDGKYFHLHGSMDPNPTLDCLGLAHDMPVGTIEESWVPFVQAVETHESGVLQHMVSDVYKQAGTICWTPEAYKESEHGQANAHVGLFEVQHRKNSLQPPSWWPDCTSTSSARPLAGLKVVELTRVIAGPAIGRGLAELGASVIRVTAPHLPDISSLHPDLNHGKWNTCLDLRQAQDRDKLRGLILDADVFLQGYRPGALDKYGFSEQEILELCEKRERGIIYATENCYGSNGPWASRSGWQQISDANTGVSYLYGRAMGNDEPVTPVFPNSDYCTGIAGAVGIITALLKRSESGGSYVVQTALNYYSQWLVNTCGVYPDEVWKHLHRRNGSLVFRHYHSMQYTIPRVFKAILESDSEVLSNPRFFTRYHAKPLGKDIKIVAPVLQYVGGEVKPGFHIGTRTNGVDQARWPEDLSAEFID